MYTPTPKETKAVKMLSDGVLAIKVAKDLKMPKPLLDHTLANLRLEFKCKNTTHLVAHFLRNKLID